MEPMYCAMCGKLIEGELYSLDDSDGEVACAECYASLLETYSGAKGDETDE